MPIHDWTLVQSGLFHHFHQDWSIELARTLNRGLLRDGLYAPVEQRVDGPEPDVIAVETTSNSLMRSGALVLDRPKASQISHAQTDAGRYSRRANRISIRHPLGHVVAIVEIVSPGNKDSRAAFRSFVQKAVEFIRAGINLLIVDLFPPSDRDPHGIHRAIWDEIANDPFELPAGKRLTAVSYDVSDDTTAYIEPLAIGDELPSMPLFLAAGEHVLVPLEATYQATWSVCPSPIRTMLASVKEANNLG